MMRDSSPAKQRLYDDDNGEEEKGMRQRLL